MLAGDICYERDLAARVADWLAGLARRGATVLIGDPGRSYLPRERLEALATYEVRVTRGAGGHGDQEDERLALQAVSLMFAVIPAAEPGSGPKSLALQHARACLHHCEERSDDAIQKGSHVWIASLRSQ